jgi:hypothetical protein
MGCSWAATGSRAKEFGASTLARGETDRHEVHHKTQLLVRHKPQLLVRHETQLLVRHKTQLLIKTQLFMVTYVAEEVVEEGRSSTWSAIGILMAA